MNIDNEYFELLREIVKLRRDEHTDEYGHHPCAPHEKHQYDKCPELCECGHRCYDHAHLNGNRFHYNGPKPTAYLCLEPGCPCRMFVDKSGDVR